MSDPIPGDLALIKYANTPVYLTSDLQSWSFYTNELMVVLVVQISPDDNDDYRCCSKTCHVLFSNGKLGWVLIEYLYEISERHNHNSGEILG